jgi:regulator of sigma E protease
MAAQVLVAALSFVVVITVVVGVHEFGHFVLGKWSGIRVDEFSIGFGPRIVSRRRGETTYSVRALPLGGYVRMAGMLGLEGEADAGERNFYRATRPRRFATIAAGIVFNFVLGVICLTVVFAAQPGSPWVIAAGGPAANAGVPQAAAIVAVGGRSIDDSSQNLLTQLRAAVQSSAGSPVAVTYRRSDGSTGSAMVKPALALIMPQAQGSVPAGEIFLTSIDGRPVGTGDPATLLAGAGAKVTGYLEQSQSSVQGKPVSGTVSDVADLATADGTQPEAVWVLGVVAGVPQEPVLDSARDAVLFIPNFVQQTGVGIYDLITQPQLGGVNGPNGLSGPVGIAQATATVSQNGLLSEDPPGLLFWIGFISMNLGLINLLPIPFLDGGKLLFILIEAVRRKRLDPRYEAVASAIGLAFVVLFLVYVTIGDVNRIR